MIGYIYKTTNKKNGRVYIGKCKSSVVKDYYGSGVELRKDIEKYGFKRFKVKVLKKCNTLRDLNESEKYYIEKYRKKLGRENCYNIANGGQGGFGHSYSESRSFFIKRFLKKLGITLLIVVPIIMIIILLVVR